MTEFSTCSIETLQSLINNSKAGRIDLRDYWSIGDTRIVAIPESMQRPFIKETEVEFRVIDISNAGEGQTVTFDYSTPMNVSHYRSSEEVREYIKQLIIDLAKSQFGLEPSTLRLDSVENSSYPSRSWSDSKTAWTQDSFFKEIPPETKAIFGAI